MKTSSLVSFSSIVNILVVSVAITLTAFAVLHKIRTVEDYNKVPVRVACRLETVLPNRFKNSLYTQDILTSVYVVR